MFTLGKWKNKRTLNQELFSTAAFWVAPEVLSVLLPLWQQNVASGFTVITNLHLNVKVFFFFFH